MKLAIMQPYFLPYIGYFQLIGAVDEFIVYDNIKYTKKGWFNRNRFLQNGADAMFTVPLKKDSDALDVRERQVSPDFDRQKLLNQWSAAYRKAPQLAQVFPLLETIVNYPEPNLFGYLWHSIDKVCGYLGLGTRRVVSSTVEIDHGLKGQDKVLALCKARGATAYFNPIGGTELYDKAVFAAAGVSLHFLKAGEVRYAQLGQPFVPFLSILDVMMFNPPEALAEHLKCYSLL